MNKSLKQLLSLKGKTAVITGGAGYLGTAISETLAELGANLVIASRDHVKCAAKCEELVRQIGGGIQAIGRIDNSATGEEKRVHAGRELSVGGLTRQVRAV